MKILAFTVYDSKTEAYLPPFFCRTEGEAIRAFGHNANQPGHGFCEHPGDYTLFASGSFDDESGMFMQDSALKNLGTALQFVRGAEKLDDVEVYLTENGEDYVREALEKSNKDEIGG